MAAPLPPAAGTDDVLPLDNPAGFAAGTCRPGAAGGGADGLPVDALLFDAGTARAGFVVLPPVLGGLAVES